MKIAVNLEALKFRKGRMQKLAGKALSRGFGFLWLIVGLALFVALCGILLPPTQGKTDGEPHEKSALSELQQSVDDAKLVKLNTLIQSLKTAAMRFYTDTGSLPVEDDEVARHDLSVKNAGISNWSGPYLFPPLSSRENPWGLPIKLTRSADKKKCELILSAPTSSSANLTRAGFRVESSASTGILARISIFENR